MFTPTIPAVCIGHRAMHVLFGGEAAYDYSAGGEPAVGAVGEKVNFEPKFDGWGYVSLFDRESFATLDTFVIDEAHDEEFAFGFGDLTVHEVATDLNDAGRAYLAYYSGGVRSIAIECADESDSSTCEMVETGGYLAPEGNDFWVAGRPMANPRGRAPRRQGLAVGRRPRQDLRHGRHRDAADARAPSTCR